MTTYIPALTLPERLFASPAASILTPIVLGSGVGIGVSSRLNAESWVRPTLHSRNSVLMASPR